MQLRSYATRRIISVNEGVAETLTGYAIYFNTSVMDYTIVDRQDDYTGTANILYSSVVLLEVFSTIGMVALLYLFLDELYAITHNTRWSQTMYFVWACVIVAFLCAVTAIVLNFTVIIGSRLVEANGSPARASLYYISILVFLLAIAFDVTAAVVLTKIKSQPDLPVPYAIRFVCCIDLRCCRGSTLFLQWLAILSLLLATQLLAFHSVFLTLAFMASPVQAGASILFFGACVFCGVSVLTLFLAVLHRRPSHLGVTVRFVLFRLITVTLFLVLLAFVVLFSYYFLRVTVFSGDSQTGGLTNIIASVVPSALLAGLGWFAKRMFERYHSTTSGKDDTKSQGNGVELQSVKTSSSFPPSDVQGQASHYT